MKQRKGPYPSPSFAKLGSADIVSPLVATISGEFTVSKRGVPLGSVALPCRVADVWASVGASGKDDSNTLSFAVNVKINGTTCLSTQPVIAHVSGEASTNKTTKETGDTGVTQAVLSSSNSVSVGDVITYDLVLTRTSSPTTEMANATVVVEFEPVF